jgi:ABC-2 type transport system permease protein
MNRILTIINKEWAEVFKTRTVLGTVAFMPLIMTILPLVVLYFTSSATGSVQDSVDVPAGFFQACGDLPAGDCMQVFILNEFLIMFMIIPATIPVAIAAYSVVGEKTTRSLEPLLATPITTMELLAGKSLAAVIPAVTASLLGFAIFLLASPLVGMSPAAREVVFGPTWLIAVLVVGPLMAVLAVNAALIVSSRVNDPRAAEQISMVVILPLLLLLFGQIAGVVILNSKLMIGIAVALALIDVGLIAAGARLFEREAILTKWK